MSALTAQFLYNIESRWRLLADNSYQSLISSDNLWWPKLCKAMPGDSQTQIFTWLLQTSQITNQGKLGGENAYSQLSMAQHSAELSYAGQNFRIGKAQLTDADGNGVKLGASWVEAMTIQAAYWPQRQAVAMLKNGESTSGLLAYDGKAMFATDHPVHPKDPSFGTYANLIGSLDISAAVSDSVALTNLATLNNTVSLIKQANGEDLRLLNIEELYCGPKLWQRIKGLLGAVQVSGTDVRATVEALGIKQIVKVPELAGWESDTSYFVKTSAIGVGNELAPIVYLENEPFTIRYFTGDGSGSDLSTVEWFLSRTNEVELKIQGRNGVAYGHPYSLIKCKAAAL